MLTTNAVASILRAKSLDFDVLNKMKQVASQFDRQSGDRIVLLSDYIVTIRMYIHTPYASGNTNRQQETVPPAPRARTRR